MKRSRKSYEEESEEDEESLNWNSDSDDECSDGSSSSDSDDRDTFNYDKYKDKLFGNTDKLDETVYDIIKDFDSESKDEYAFDSDNYDPSQLSLQLQALFEGIRDGNNVLHFTNDPKERSDALRIIINESHYTDEAPFSVYIMQDDIVKTTKKKKSETFLEYCKRCTTVNDGKIVDFLTRCNKRFNLFDLYYGYIFFQSPDLDNYSDREEYYEDDEELEKVKIIDLYHSESGKYFTRELIVSKTGDVFPEDSFGSGKLLSNENEKIEVTASLCMVIIPK